METMNLDEVSKVLKISKATARNRLSLGLPMPPSFNSVQLPALLRESGLIHLSPLALTIRKRT